MYRNINFATVNSNASVYENISVKKDPMFAKVISAIKIVKDFITNRGLIIYGGTAIDYALRLKGDKIYSDENLLFPDLDFYSPNNVQDAYDLADQLYDAGFDEARVIVATYVRTMRVDIGDNHFIADITYMPPEIFKSFKYLEYSGMRMVDPQYQKIDLHSSLSYPYDNSPREVIFHRWNKDIKRLGLLDKYYPTEFDNTAVVPKSTDIKVKLGPWIKKCVIGGWAAYASLCEHYEKLLKLVQNHQIKIPEDMPKFAPLNISFDKEFMTFSGPTNNLDLFGQHVTDLVEDFVETGAEIVHRASLTNIIEESITIKNKTGPIINLLDIHEKLLSCNIQDSPQGIIRMESAQGLLRFFLSQSMFNKDNNQLYIYYYNQTQNVIKAAELLLRAIIDQPIKKEEIKMLFVALERKSPFHPSISFFGQGNHSENYEFSLARLTSSISKEPMPPEYVIPIGYRPEKSRDKKPTFDYEKSKFFIKDGRILKK